MTRRQIVVVGAGLVGSAAALALGRAGYSVALVERARPAALTEDWDARVYAISPASQSLLETLAVWQRLPATRLQPVTRMDVAGDARGAVRLDAYRAGVPRLATLLESGRLQHALWDALEADGAVALHCPASVVTLGPVPAGSSLTSSNPSPALSKQILTLDDGSVLEAELVVAADGLDSRIRELAGLSAVKTAYGQRGVVANLACEKPHRGTAFQWFSGDGEVVAWLPLPGKHVSLVWSADDAHAEALLQCDAAEFAERVAAAGGHRLGALRLLAPAQAFPLQLVRVPQLTAPGLVFIGDAAHGVHPLAGQGVNLGFADVATLTATLTAARRASPGDPRVLARHERLRAEPVAVMQAATDGLYHLFANPRPQGLRNVGMALVNRLPPLKTALIRHALT